MMVKYSIDSANKPLKRKYHRDSTMSDAEIMVIMILFHSSGYKCLKHFYIEQIFDKLIADKGCISKNLFHKLFVDGIQLITKLKSNMKGAMMSVTDKVLLRKRAIIETVNDELKNIAQVEHSRHRSLQNFTVNLLAGIAAYCYFPKKPAIDIIKTTDNQLTLF